MNNPDSALAEKNVAEQLRKDERAAREERARERLADERLRLAKSSQLYWFHWAILAMSLALTLFVGNYFAVQAQERNRAQFYRESTRVVEQVVERMRKYEDALWAGAAMIASHGGSVTPGQWRTYAQELRIEQEYPGINGIGVIERVEHKDRADYIARQRLDRKDFDIHPKHSERENLPIVFIEPEEQNLKAVGLDMAHESNRYAAAKRARETGLAQITGPIVLVQDEAHTSGFLFYVPYYRNGTLPTVYSRKKGFIGLVYSPFVVKNLIAGTLDRERRRVGLRISDGAEAIYDEQSAVASGDDTAGTILSFTESVELYGRQWVIDTWPNAEFFESTETHQPLFILLAGVAIDILLLTLFLFQSRASRRALDYADRLTSEIKNKTLAVEKTNNALKKSNDDLKSFAYVASHDLKTPLRGIRDLTSYLEEDLMEYMRGPDANPNVEKNIKRLFQQSKRMNNLILGILEYSNVDGKDELKEVNLRRMVTAIGMELNVRFDQIKFMDFNPVFKTYGVRFQQVISNLVENAFKYHPNMTRAEVQILCKDSGAFYEISVSDNGAGIDKEYHERIFEPFQALQAKDEIESTGIGLALVKRTVDSVGGQIWLRSEQGQGAVFTFLWPKQVKGGEQTKQRAA